MVLPRPSAANLDRGGCFGTGAGNIGGNHSIVKIDSSYMTENSSYSITVVVEKHPRRAYFTQEVVISPGDPPVVEIRYDHGTIMVYIYTYIHTYIKGVTVNIDNSRRNCAHNTDFFNNFAVSDQFTY